MTIIAPSILSADFGHLARDVKMVDDAGAEWIHCDVMDGRYVPNISIGIPVVAAVRQNTKRFVDVHLMIVEPEKYIDDFAAAGADGITVHQEACPHLQRTLSSIRALGKKAGCSLNPSTSEEVLRYVATDLDLVLVMSVNPGFGGQKFLPTALEKVRRIRALLDAAGNTGCVIEVDGGVGPGNAFALGEAGASALVAGNAVYKAQDPKAAIAEMKKACDEGRAQAGRK